ncbi:MAG: transcription elongation factor GreA [Christensenellales bacterium]
MANEKQVVLTRKGFEDLEQRLEFLKTVRRREVADRIKEARGFGDLSENSEYDAAKDEQAFLEGEIATIENQLRNAQIVEEGAISDQIVQVGATVLVHDEDEDFDETYKLAGATESDPMNNVISTDSPVGAALLGKAKGEVVEVAVPDGVIRLRIVQIQ